MKHIICILLANSLESFSIQMLYTYHIGTYLETHFAILIAEVSYCNECTYNLVMGIDCDIHCMEIGHDSRKSYEINRLSCNKLDYNYITMHYKYVIVCMRLYMACICVYMCIIHRNTCMYVCVCVCVYVCVCVVPVSASYYSSSSSFGTIIFKITVPVLVLEPCITFRITVLFPVLES